MCPNVSVAQLSGWAPKREELDTPLYLSIAALLERDIASGALPPNSKLPPQRDLADYLGVSLNTVTRAYAICERKGIIYATTGSGTYVATNASTSVWLAVEPVGPSIEMGIIEAFPQFNSQVSLAAQTILKRAGAEQLFAYSNPTGGPRHKLAGQVWLAMHNLKVNPEDLILVAGAQNGMAIALTALFRPGERLAVDPYTYPNLIELAKLLHIQLVPVENDADGMRPDVLEELCHAGRLHGLYLMPSCCNPTTLVMSSKRREQLAEVIKKYALLLIEDDVYGFLARENVPFAARLPEQTISLYSLSKAVSGGLRVAFMVAPERCRSALTSCMYSINLKTSSLNAEVAAELVLSGAAEELAAQKTALARDRNRIMQTHFAEYAQPAEPGNPCALFWWMRLPQHLQAFNGRQFEQLALDYGVKLFHSNRFLVGGPEGPAHIRVALCSARSERELLEGAVKLKNLLQTGMQEEACNDFIV